MREPISSYQRVHVQADGRHVVSQAGSVLLTGTVRKAGLGQAISAALAPWRRPRAVHDPGMVVLDLPLEVAMGEDCLADGGMLRTQPTVFGPVASDPTVARLIGVRSTPLGSKSATESPGCRAGRRQTRTGR